MFGDDRQLGPVVVGHDAADASAASIFEHLRESGEPTLLDETFRLNEPLCRFPSRAFYGGRLRPAAPAASRRLALGGSSPAELRAVIDEPEGPVLVRIDHVGYRSVCPPERDAAVEIAAELLGRRGLPARELAIVAPFRIQNAEIARELARRLGGEAELPTIDTVERVQGQEREVVIVSMTCSDPDALRDEGRFLFSPHRLNVSLTRARTRLVVLASRRLLDAWPRDLAGLQQVDVFHRLFAELPQVDWSGRYDS
jgi:DNA replication ATP-dependent helicase Dna2